MSQFNNNNNVNGNQGNGNKVAEELRQMKIDRQNLERRDKQIRFRCDHKDGHGRPAVQQGQEDDQDQRQKALLLRAGKVLQEDQRQEVLL
jgi:hypothetical protein